MFLNQDQTTWRMEPAAWIEISQWLLFQDPAPYHHQIFKTPSETIDQSSWHLSPRLKWKGLVILTSESGQSPNLWHYTVPTIPTVKCRQWRQNRNKFNQMQSKQGWEKTIIHKYFLNLYFGMWLQVELTSVDWSVKTVGEGVAARQLMIIFDICRLFLWFCIDMSLPQSYSAGWWPPCYSLLTNPGHC